MVFHNRFHFHFNEHFPYKLQALNTTEHKFRFFIFFTINNFQVAYWWTIGRWNGCQPQGPGDHGATDRYQYLPTAQTWDWFVSSFIPLFDKAVTRYSGHKYRWTTCCGGRFKLGRLLIFWLCLIFRYSPPQVCRKLKIQDIFKKYRQELSVPDFFVSLFADENN